MNQPDLFVEYPTPAPAPVGPSKRALRRRLTKAAEQFARGEIGEDALMDAVFNLRAYL